MNIEEINLIKKLVSQQQPRESIKSELISQGFSTEGFEEMYQHILTELHIPEPSPSRNSAHVPFALPGEASFDYQSKQRAGQFRKALAIISGTVIGLVILIVIIFNAQAILAIIPGGSNTDSFSVADLVLKSNVETTAASARIYGTQMGSNDGVCKDIIVVAPVKCVQTIKAYAVYAPISNNRFYCVDSTGFSGSVRVFPAGSGTCSGG